MLPAIFLVSTSIAIFIVVSSNRKKNAPVCLVLPLAAVAFISLLGSIIMFVELTTITHAPTPENIAELTSLEAKQARIEETLAEIADLDYSDPTIEQIVNGVEGKSLAGDLSASDTLEYYQIVIAEVEAFRQELYEFTPRYRWWLYFGH